MKIKTKLHVSIVFSLTMIIMVPLIFYVSQLQTRKIEEGRRLNLTMIKGVSELKSVTLDYLLHRDERSRTQWHARFESLKRITIVITDDSKHIELRKKVREDLDLIREVFIRFEAGADQLPPSIDRDAARRDVDNMLVSQLMIKSDVIIADSFRLQNNSSEEALADERWTDLLIIFFVGISAFSLAANTFMLRTSILKPLLRLRKGTEVIAGGDLNYRVGISGDDEIGELYRAFDDMTVKLQRSYEILNNEIAERKRAEEAQRSSDKKFRTLADSIPNLAWWANSDGYLTWYNRRWYEYTGTTPEQMEGWGWQSVHDPNELPKVLECWQASIATGEPFEMTFPLRGSDGIFRSFLTRIIPLKDNAGRVQQWFGTSTDVSELKRIEQELRESEERLAAVMENLSEGLIMADDQGEGIYWNPAALAMFGYASLNDCPRKLAEFADTFEVRPLNEDRQVPVEDWPMSRVLRGEVLHECEVRLRRLDQGWEKILAYSGWLIRSASGERLTFVCTTDITERKRADEQIKSSLAEKEVMLKEIHHRVKNNLQVISSLVSLQADNLTDEKTRGEFNDVCDRVRSMALIHEKLYQTKDLAQLNFADYATSLLRSLWRSHGTLAEKARLNLALAPVMLSIETAVPCGLLLNELAGNALKHAFPNDSVGEVTVGLEHDSAFDAVRLWVRDNGVGLPEGLDWRQSRSLGLRLVQILAGQLHGTVESGTGPGAEFRVTFPLIGVEA